MDCGGGGEGSEVQSRRTGVKSRGHKAKRKERVCGKGESLKDPPVQGKRNGSKDPPLQREIRGLPGGAGSGALDPVNRLGAGVRKFLGRSREPFSDGIPPNIAGDILDLICRPKNVVVVTRFPKSNAV